MRKKRRAARRRPNVALWAVFAVAAVALVGLSYFIGQSYLAGAGKIVHGVEVAGVSLGGETPEDAGELLDERISAPEQVKISGGGEEISLSSERLGVRYDIEETVQNAYTAGREEGLLSQVATRVGGMFGPVEVPVVATYDEESVVSRFEQLSREIASEPRPAEVFLDGGEARVSAPREGYEVDVAATAENVRRAIENRSGEATLEGRPLELAAISAGETEAAAEVARAATEAPVVLSAGERRWELAPEQVARAMDFVPEGGELRLSLDREAVRSELEGLFSDLNSEVQEASYEVRDGEVKVVPSQMGYELDEERMFGDLATGLPEGRHDYELPVAETGEPRFTTADAREQRPTEKLGEYRTRHTTPGNLDALRVENLRIASRAINGRTLAPGEVFSANDVLAPLEYEKASVFVGGVVEDRAGGGLCQVSSTLHMAANLAGMEPVERHPHYAMLDYIRPGLDATVWFGAANGFSGQELDMKFRNTSEGRVFIRQYVADDDYIYAEVWGQPTGEETTMTSESLYINDQSAKWATNKTVKRDGEVVRDEQMYTSTYEGITEDGETQPPSEVRIAPNTP